MSFQDQDRQQVQLALQQWSSGQRLTALQTLDAFSFENPQAHRSRATLAKLLIEQGESERALQVVELGLTIAPRHDDYRKIKARLLLGAGRADEALALMSAGAPSVSADPEFHDLLATAYLAAGRFDNAVISYQMLLQQDEDVGRWWYGLGAAFDAEGRSTSAATAFERALRSGDLSAGLRQTSQQRLQSLRRASGQE
jgi:Flp pilus assembly protein TadD